ncbi:MAG TPA: amino acid ABC transporter substrate-binding protein [Candidatus Pelethomonas intestinigallinarum]|nr:amino acid ABC transporter substrate-binding protein [Candidatus Pelethomonas intestinigallinarum]
MKKFLSLVLALALALSLAACGGTGNNGGNTTGNGGNANTSADTNTSADADTGDDAGEAGFTTVEEGKLIMSTNAAFPPYEMTTDDGGFEGIDVEIAQAIAEKLGLELQIDDMDFTAALEAVQAGMSDMAMAGITVNEERLAVMDFSDTYATGVQVVIVKEGSDVTLDNLGEQLIGVQNGTTGWQFCSDDFGDDHVAAFDNGITAVQALVNDQVDCVVIDQGPAEVFVSENPGLTILETEYAIEDYAIGVNKGNTALLDAINGALAELQEDGTIQSIIDKYISAE